MNIAVCEDISADSGVLCDMISDYCKTHCYDSAMSSFKTGEALLAAVTPGAFDIYFLDIYLPGISGVEVARKIREIDKDCFLVFVTISKDFMAEGFEVSASSYIVKPITREAIELAMHNCRMVFERSSRMIDIPYEGKSLMVSLADLYYVEVYDKESVFHMKRGKIKTRLSLKSVSERLGGSPFLRCHRSYIINMNYVEDMREENFVMRNGDLVPIRKNGRKEVRLAIAEFIASSPQEAT